MSTQRIENQEPFNARYETREHHLSEAAQWPGMSSAERLLHANCQGRIPTLEETSFVKKREKVNVFGDSQHEK